MTIDLSDTKSARDLEAELLTLFDDGYDHVDGVKDATSFDDCGMMTRNRGVVVRLANGSEFQLTIVQSRDHDGFDGEGDADDDA